ncbi:MAG: glycoside hydrolase family 95 protein [Clostridium sp.]
MNKIWFDKKASEWEEAIPIGNGRLGAMIPGAIIEEVLYLNEDSIWYGGDCDRHNPDTIKYLDEIRALLFKGDVTQAGILTKAACSSTPKYINPYHPLCYLSFDFMEQEGEAREYKRVLDLDNALAKVSYTLDGTKYEREYLASFSNQVIGMRFKATGDKKLSFMVNINRRPLESVSYKVDDNTIMIEGQSGPNGIKFVGGLTAKVKGGSVESIGDFLLVKEVDEAELYFTAYTDFREANYKEHTLLKLQLAKSEGYTSIKKRHIKEYTEIYSKNTLKINQEYEDIPTDELLKKCTKELPLKQVSELFYNFGKYLLIGSSREGTLPANLQGIWNSSYTPAWESNYTININLQMNYWPVDVCNLGACYEPLANFVKRLCENGKETARRLYDCKGSVAHHATNIWAQSEPVGILGPSPYWPMGLGWLAIHLVEHYRYSLDKKFLVEDVYPVLKEVAIFYCDYLVESPEGYLVTGPSLSPENTYFLPNGQKAAICMGPSMDTQIIIEVFNAILEISEELILSQEEEHLNHVIKEKMKKLPPIKVGKYGQIMEWYQDYEEWEKGHRHISQLFALYPGSQITYSNTPELMEASKVTLNRRLENGGGHTGWSKAWIINFYARLLDGEVAYKHLQEMLLHLVKINLFNVHPPFQIDGNFGACAAIAEMLIQSHEGFIRLLPALPREWKVGEAVGFCARGGFELEFTWENHQINTLRIRSKKEGICKIEASWIKSISTTQGKLVSYEVKGNIICFKTEENQVYEILG